MSSVCEPCYCASCGEAFTWSQPEDTICSSCEEKEQEERGYD